MGFSKYLLFAEDSRFHLGFINGPYSKVSYRQCHIKSSSFLLVPSPPANIFLANLSCSCFILISRNPVWDTFIKVPPAISIPFHCSISSPSQSLVSLKYQCPPIASLNSPVPSQWDFAYKHSLGVTLYPSPSYLGCHTRNYWKHKFSFSEDQYLYLWQGKLKTAIKNNIKNHIKHKVESSRS